MPNQEENVPTLQGQEAIELWLSGKDSWNEWVDNNPDYNVDFSNVDFGTLKAEHNLEKISFFGYRFAKGAVRFEKAQFGKGYVEFREARFGEGYVDFFKAQFGEGAVSFYGAEFGKGWVDFREAEFGKGYVIFDWAEFGEGGVSFNEARFGEGNVSFRGAEFGKGDVSFDWAEFGKGDVGFTWAKFGEGGVSFRAIKKESGYFSFIPKQLKHCTNLNMSRSTIESVLEISGIDSPVVLNLTHSKLSYPVDIDKANIDFRWAYHYFDFRRAINATDSTSFRRLKKLALEAGDHERALDFYAKEMRTSYWHYITGPKLALYYLYDWISDYGRSIWRPLFGLALIITIFAAIYMSFATNKAASFYDGLVYSAGSAIPFYSGSRLAQSVGTSKLFGEEITSLPDWIPAIAIGQGIISGIFIFLIVLALRNTFRS